MKKTSIKVQEESDKKVFAQGYCLAKIFFLFLIGCVIGVYYEEILTFINKGVWESRRGIIYGPFNPVYGLGFIIFVVVFGKNYEKRKWYINLIGCCILGGLVESGLGYFIKLVFNVESWNYSNYFLNIGRYTTLPFMIIWGLGGFSILYVVYPWLSKLIEKIPYKIGRPLYIILFIFMILNMVISYTALFRQSMRKAGHEPLTPVGKIYDKVYTDDFLEKVYPNMKHNVENKAS